MTIKTLMAASAVSILALFATIASAADADVRCEKRTSRSSASIDGKNLASGFYRAVLKSGSKTSRSDFDQAIGHEVEFDFDSNPNDINLGATPIPANFIVDGQVRGYLVNQNGQRVTPISTVMCRVRR
jgi:hypothetical protein